MRYFPLLFALACGPKPPAASPGATVPCGDTSCTTAQYCVRDTTIANHPSPTGNPPVAHTGYRCTDEMPRGAPGTTCTTTGERQLECTSTLP